MSGNSRRNGQVFAGKYRLLIDRRTFEAAIVRELDAIRLPTPKIAAWFSQGCYVTRWTRCLMTSRKAKPLKESRSRNAVVN